MLVLNARRWEAIGLALAVALPLVVFAGAAIGLDAPVFVAVAKQIVLHPLDPFGFDMIWDPVSPHVAHFNQNPPLFSYWLAVPLALVGEIETALHVATWIFPLIAVAAFYGIATTLTGAGFAPTAVLISTPAFLLLSTTLLLDVPVLSALLSSVYALVRAHSGGGKRWEWVAGFAVMAAGLTKYVGMSALPLAAAGLYFFPSARARSARAARVLGPPLVVWTAWLVATFVQYGEAHPAGGVALALQRGFEPAEFWNHLASVPVYFGGALLFPLGLLVLRMLPSRRGVELATFALVVGGGVAAFVLPGGEPARRIALGAKEAVFATFACASALTLWGEAIGQSLRVRLAGVDGFLMCWLLGTLVFSAFINWHVNAADALLAAPPAILLWFRHPDLRPRTREALTIAVLSYGVSLALTASDVAQRNLYRDAAQRIVAEIGDAPGKRWFVGHWGLQHYLEREGFQPIVPPQYERSYGASEIAFGDWVVSARNVSQLDVRRNLDRFVLDVVWHYRAPASWHLRATHLDSSAGFYSHHAGYGPMSWSGAPLDEIGLARVTRRRH